MMLNSTGNSKNTGLGSSSLDRLIQSAPGMQGGDDVDMQPPAPQVGARVSAGKRHAPNAQGLCAKRKRAWPWAQTERNKTNGEGKV